MAQNLERLFAELGISQYLVSFIEQGFDTWETILDITESDLDVLGVKLGHRRKLQRQIANSRGHAPGAALVSTTIPGQDDAKPESWRQEAARSDGKDVAVVTKRKYRRHPKADENAPERPPSAYVLFSNKMREDLKGRNLTFTEIAKLVGEHWQSLSPAEKEPYETQAMKAKEKYNKALAEYRKTPEYRKYAQYLQEFKQKQASQNKAKDASKRLKLEAGARLRHHGSGSTGGTPTSTPNGAGGTGSGSDGPVGIDTPHGRKQHQVRSPMADGHAASMVPAGVSHPHAVEDLVHSPASTHFDPEPSPLMHGSPRSTHSHSRRPTWCNSPANTESSAQLHLPSFSDMFNDRPVMGATCDSNGFGQGQQGQPAQIPPPSHQLPQPHQQTNVSRPALKHETSSTGSMGSSASMFSYQRTPSESFVPIHALLSSGSGSESGYEAQHAPHLGQQKVVQGHQYPFPPMGHAAYGATGTAAGAGPVSAPVSNAPSLLNGSHDSNHGRHNLQTDRSIGQQRPPLSGLHHATSSSSGATDGSYGSHASSRTSPSTHDYSGVSSSDAYGKNKEGFDGMNALLRAGEIVGRRGE